MRPHVDVRQTTQVQIWRLHRLDNGRRQPVGLEEQEEARRVPHLYTVVVDHCHHGADDVGNVWNVEVQVQTAEQVVRQKTRNHLYRNSSINNKCNSRDKQKCKLAILSMVAYLQVH